LKRELLALAVALRGAGDEHRALLFVRELEHQLGELDVGLDRAHRAFDDELDADRRRQVVDDIRLVDELGHERPVGTGLDDVVEARIRLEVANVEDGSGTQVVDDRDLVPKLKESLSEVRADKPGSPSNEVSHGLIHLTCSGSVSKARGRFLLLINQALRVGTGGSLAGGVDKSLPRAWAAPPADPEDL